MPNRYRLACLAIVLSLLSPCPIAAAESNPALTQRHKFDIHVQPLGSALRQLAAQSGVRILFPYDDVAHLRARRVEGWLSTREALRRLLAGTQLHMSETETGVVALAPRPPRGMIIGRNDLLHPGAA